uniref:Tubulin cofactor A n=1 Tax=Mus musculus TaxID=10090 RepID=A0A1Y7VLW1_MOUSE
MADPRVRQIKIKTGVVRRTCTRLPCRWKGTVELSWL